MLRHAADTQHPWRYRAAVVRCCCHGPTPLLQLSAVCRRWRSLCHVARHRWLLPLWRPCHRVRPGSTHCLLWPLLRLLQRWRGRLAVDAEAPPLHALEGNARGAATDWTAAAGWARIEQILHDPGCDLRKRLT